jgi:hypothetical protein
MSWIGEGGWGGGGGEGVGRSSREWVGRTEEKIVQKNGKECVAQGMRSSHRKKIGFKARLKGT